ncbi:ubiquitin thioesterase OTU1-like [Teleopsis dalmanni]|uniref:ubiquitin thioesterase OTU1-like n=1 Tax=Teleopsis dalmanni TaxID=139649 RepID=UPI0018CFC49B|nr:ubiquitin thioesterase OTU1-like [Teleopsis dalmanni]
MPKSFSVRLKFENKTHILDNLTKNTTIGIFKLRIGLLVFKNVKNLLVFMGYPPRLLDLSRNADDLNSLGINKDITLVLEQMEPEDEDVKLEDTEVMGMHRKKLFLPDRMVLTDKKTIGLFVRQQIARNASSLFTSIRYAITGRINEKASEEMREMVALKIASQPERFNRKALGMTNVNYRQWILNPSSCGGRVECSIFAEYYKTEIDVVHVNEGVVYRFGERLNFTRRMFLTQKNSHYDVLYMTYANSSLRRTLFPITEVGVYAQALKFAKKKKFQKRNQKFRFRNDTLYHVRSKLSEVKMTNLFKKTKTSLECVQTAVSQSEDVNVEESDTDDSLITPNTRENTNANSQQALIQYSYSMQDRNASEDCIIKSKISHQYVENESCVKEVEEETEVVQTSVKQCHFQQVGHTKSILKKAVNHFQ